MSTDDTAFVFPGLDGVQRASSSRPFLTLPGFRSRWQLVDDAFARNASFRRFAAALLRGENRLLPLVDDWRWPALAVAAMQLSVADELVERGERRNWLIGYSIGDVARSVHAGAASFESIVAFARELSPAPSAEGVTVVAFAPNRSRAALALALLPQPTNASYLSDRIVAVPTDRRNEATVRDVLRGQGLRFFDLAPCALHSPLQRGLADYLGRALRGAGLNPPATPVFSCVTLAPIESALELRRELAANAATPFHFADAIRRLHEDHGVVRFVNIGPGQHAEHFVHHARLPVEVVSGLDMMATAPRT